MSGSSRSPSLPRLGARGQGWLVPQVVLIALVAGSAFTKVYWPDRVAGALAVAGLVVIVTGVVLLALGVVSLLAARAMTVLPRPRAGSAVAQSGVYRFVRHPVYGAVLLIALGWSLAESPLGLVPTALLVVVFDLKARVEEAWLLEHLPAYDEYRRRTPKRFVPAVY
jgi:protein-S-isoprenylcysteine O-methyltransferase Ste14